LVKNSEMEISRCFCAICSAVARRARRAGGSVVAGAGAGSGSGGTSFGTGREPALPLAGAASGAGLAGRPGLGAGAPFGAFAAPGGAAGFAGEAGLGARDDQAGADLPGFPFVRGAATGSGGTRSSCFAATRAMDFPFAFAAALAFLDAIRQATPAISLDSL
jgi:hypothetical protein